ncbi:uncharacterized protein PRCAT00005713001 [Priceomyces carsonii]|uniref:uncharacterized protein n=1 Tax=Priceomyces carsonii TaxID=28549 RepID=UPI002ED821BB|nr:unnamed protein product [Priceomyces carsonii]
MQGSAKDYHENPLLKLLKATKKEKLAAKSNKFTQQLMNKVTFNTSGGISKSSIRRRRRKEKEQLKPQMNDLLISLPDSFEDSKYPSSKNQVQASKKRNIPNATKKTGHQKLFQQEKKNFTDVLNSPDFKSAPFSALRNAILQNATSK